MDHVEAEGPIRVLLVDDHVSFRQALAFLFDREPGLSVVAQAGTLAEARRTLDARESPEGVEAAVVDLGLPDGNGAEFIEDLLRRDPSAIVLVLSATLSSANFARALEAGASGVLDKLAGLEQIIAAVRRLREGEALPAQREVRELLRLYARRDEAANEVSETPLAPREVEVLQALADGLGSEEITGKLRISAAEERECVANILDKLGARSRLEALAIAARRDLVEIG